MKLQYLILFFGILVSCKKTDQVPVELYGKEEMAKILKDIYLLEFQIKELNLPIDSSKKVFDNYQKRYFKKNDIDTSLYRDSYQFYLEHPELMEEVYAIIADSLSLQNRIESKKE